mmetsp:Transcript_26807/g.50586  ORF Transcript_26807/g.50586 Transcript_26807/m.50586 type:complete len:90 (-) Transcript_26807:1162-1431(-)
MQEDTPKANSLSVTSTYCLCKLERTAGDPFKGMTRCSLLVTALLLPCRIQKVSLNLILKNSDSESRRIHPSRIEQNDDNDTTFGFPTNK